MSGVVASINRSGLRPVALANLQSALAILKPNEWYAWIDVVISAIGLNGLESDITTDNPALPDHSIVTSLGHRTLRDFISAPMTQNGLGHSWKDWTSKLSAYKTARQYEIDHLLCLYTLVNSQNSTVCAELGRDAIGPAEWHRTLASALVRDARNAAAQPSRIVNELTNELRALRTSHDNVSYELQRYRDEQQPLRDTVDSLTQQLAAIEIEHSQKSRALSELQSEFDERSKELRYEFQDYFSGLLSQATIELKAIKTEAELLKSQLEKSGSLMNIQSNELDSLRQALDESKRIRLSQEELLRIRETEIGIIKNRKTQSPEMLDDQTRLLVGQRLVIQKIHKEKVKFQAIAVHLAREKNRYKSLYMNIPRLLRNIFN